MLMTAIDAARAYDRRLDRQAGDDAVVVGIGYPEGVDAGAERMYDMTPPGSGDSRIKRPTGGADAFLDLIEHDLKPAVAAAAKVDPGRQAIFGHSLGRSEEHTSELQSLMRISYAVFCLKKKK